MTKTYNVNLGDKTDAALVTNIPHVSNVTFRFLREETIKPTLNIPINKIWHYQLQASKLSVLSFSKWVIKYRNKWRNSEQEEETTEEYIENPTTTSGPEEIKEQEIQYWDGSTSYTKIVSISAVFFNIGNNKILRNGRGVILTGRNGTILRLD